MLQRKRYTILLRGGGQVNDFVFRFYGIPFFKTYRYKKIEHLPSLEHSHLLTSTFPRCPDVILEKTKILCKGLDKDSIETVYKIIHRTKESFYNPTYRYFRITQEEIQMLEKIKDFKGSICEITPNVFYWNGYFLPINQFEVSVFFYKHGMHTLKTLDKLKQKDIIDVGGFIGDSAILFQEFTDKVIHTFEATTKNYKLLLQTLELNNAARIKPIKKALGSINSAIEIGLLGSASSFVLRKDVAKNKETVEIITLDSYVKENNVEVGFIKVDIEGFEMEFIKGAKETICTQKPTMLISIYHQSSDFFDIKPLLESWNLGYKFYIYHPCDGGVSGETALFCEVVE